MTPEERCQAEQEFDIACEQARVLLADATKSDIENRYKLARIAKEVQRKKVHKGQTLALFAAGIGSDKATVYKWVKVAAFDEDVIARVLGSPDEQGRILSWEHLVLCASVRDAAYDLIDFALEQRPSVRELREEATRRRTKKKPGHELWRQIEKLNKQLARAAMLANEIAHDAQLDTVRHIVATETLSAVCQALESHARTIPAALEAVLEVRRPSKRPSAGAKPVASAQPRAETGRITPAA